LRFLGRSEEVRVAGPEGDEGTDLRADGRCLRIEQALGIKGVDQEFLDVAEQRARGHLTHDTYPDEMAVSTTFFPWHKPVAAIALLHGFRLPPLEKGEVGLEQLATRKLTDSDGTGPR
jgi:hypothetical protein